MPRKKKTYRWMFYVIDDRYCNVIMSYSGNTPEEAICAFTEKEVVSVEYAKWECPGTPQSFEMTAVGHEHYKQWDIEDEGRAFVYIAHNPTGFIVREEKPGK